MKTLLRRCSLFVALLAPLSAFAHPGHDGHDFTWDFSAGFAHPLTGVDHLLAMIAVGFWAAQLGGRARWLVPSAFVAAMIGGAALGRAGLAFSGLEQLIAASVLVLGLLVATAARVPLAASTALVGVFALFHGFAHGAGMPAAAAALQFGLGFVVATALLLAAGLALGQSSTRLPARAVKLTGFAIAACGAVLFAS
ncbi:MAG TPA: HupE/UreJ family protein [Opitutus sp.]|nr:HupE/UreJ family protein [Opitutus sp.]